MIAYLKHSVICIFNKNKEEYNVKTSENDVKYSSFNMGVMDKSRELYSKEFWKKNSAVGTHYSNRLKCDALKCQSPRCATIFLPTMFACWHSHLYRWRPTIRMNEAWRIKYGILVSDKILIFSLFVGCFYRKGPALNRSWRESETAASIAAPIDEDRTEKESGTIHEVQQISNILTCVQPERVV